MKKKTVAAPNDPKLSDRRPKAMSTTESDNGGSLERMVRRLWLLHKNLSNINKWLNKEAGYDNFDYELIAEVGNLGEAGTLKWLTDMMSERDEEMDVLDKRAKALEKLTPEERALLGIGGRA